MIFLTSVPGILFGFTPRSLKVHVNVSKCSKVLLSSAMVLVSALPTLFGRSVTVSVLNVLSHFTHHVLKRSMFSVMVGYVVLSCTTCGHGLVRLLVLLNVVATMKSNHIIGTPAWQGFFFYFKKFYQCLATIMGRIRTIYYVAGRFAFPKSPCHNTSNAK